MKTISIIFQERLKNKIVESMISSRILKIFRRNGEDRTLSQDELKIVERF
jgi:hypothetical protein